MDPRTVLDDLIFLHSHVEQLDFGDPQILEVPRRLLDGGLDGFFPRVRAAPNETDDFCTCS